jgi:hypothetical protein
MILITQQRVGHAHHEILALQIAARENGWDVLTAPTSWRLDEDLIKSGVKGVPYGSQTFCEVISQQMGWTLVANPFDWLAKLPPEYLKRKVDFMTLGEAKRLTETKFIKPADDKVFLAGVYVPGTLVVNVAVPDDTPTLVSEVVEFDLEYRCFVDGKQMVTWSNYIYYDNIADSRYWHTVDLEETHLPQEFADILMWEDIKTMPSTVDVGRIKGKGLAIIETNQAWASGIYGCDPSGVLKVLEKSCY